MCYYHSAALLPHTPRLPRKEGKEVLFWREWCGVATGRDDGVDTHTRLGRQRGRRARGKGGGSGVGRKAIFKGHWLLLKEAERFSA